MTTHVLVAVSETDTTVRWECQVCHRYSDFSKPGFGEPSATMFSYPENVDSYMDPCPGEYVGASRNVLRNDFFGRFTSEELGNLETSQDHRIIGMMVRMKNTDPIDLADPTWLADLTYAEGQGLLTEGRAAIICQ